MNKSRAKSLLQHYNKSVEETCPVCASSKELKAVAIKNKGDYSSAVSVEFDTGVKIRKVETVAKGELTINYTKEIVKTKEITTITEKEFNEF